MQGLNLVVFGLTSSLVCLCGLTATLFLGGVGLAILVAATLFSTLFITFRSEDLSLSTKSVLLVSPLIFVPVGTLVVYAQFASGSLPIGLAYFTDLLTQSNTWFGYSAMFCTGVFFLAIPFDIIGLAFGWYLYDR